jgi:hypothetical protein
MGAVGELETVSILPPVILGEPAIVLGLADCFDAVPDLGDSS